MFPWNSFGVFLCFYVDVYVYFYVTTYVGQNAAISEFNILSVSEFPWETPEIIGLGTIRITFVTVLPLKSVASLDIADFCPFNLLDISFYPPCWLLISRFWGISTRTRTEHKSPFRHKHQSAQGLPSSASLQTL